MSFSFSLSYYSPGWTLAGQISRHPSSLLQFVTFMFAKSSSTSLNQNLQTAIFFTVLLILFYLFSILSSSRRMSSSCLLLSLYEVFLSILALNQIPVFESLSFLIPTVSLSIVQFSLFQIILSLVQSVPMYILLQSSLSSV